MFDERRADDAQRHDRRHEVLVREQSVVRVAFGGVAEDRAQQKQEDQRQRDREEDRRRAAPEELLVVAELVQQQLQAGHGSTVSAGQLEVDVLERRARDTVRSSSLTARSSAQPVSSLQQAR